MKNSSSGAVRGNGTGKVAGKTVWRDGAMTMPLLARITSAVEEARTRGPDKAALRAADLATLEAIADASTALVVSFGRLVRAGMRADDAESLVISSAIESVAAGEADDAAELAAGTWRRCRAELRRERRFAERHQRLTLADESLLAEEPPDLNGRLLLRWAVDAGIVVRIGHFIRFDPDAVARWVESHRVEAQVETRKRPK